VRVQLLQVACCGICPQIPQARHGHSLLCIKYCFHGPDQKILTDAGRGKACLIVKGEHGVHKVS